MGNSVERIEFVDHDRAAPYLAKTVRLQRFAYAGLLPDYLYYRGADNYWNVISTEGRLNRRERFEQPTKFARSKFERPKVGLKGELQDVIRNGRKPVVNLQNLAGLHNYNAGDIIARSREISSIRSR